MHQKKAGKKGKLIQPGNTGIAQGCNKARRTLGQARLQRNIMCSTQSRNKYAILNVFQVYFQKKTRAKMEIAIQYEKKTKKVAVDYLDKSSERKNMEKIFNCGKMPLGGGNLLFHSTSMSRFLQSFAKLFCQQLENHQKSACLLRQLKFQIPWQKALCSA